MKAMIRPPYLQEGDTIGIFSPSAPATAWIPERTKLAVQYIEKCGFRVKHGSLSGRQAHYRSGRIRERAEELNELIHDPEVKCIMAASGGFVSNSLLPYIDYRAIEKDPKIFVGYSDVTAILLSIYAKTGLCTYYGPMLISTLGEEAPFSADSFEQFLRIAGGKINVPYAYEKPSFWTDDSVGMEEKGVHCQRHENEWTTVRKGRATGRLIGGNLNTLLGFFGTPYMPEIRKNDILMLEENRQTPESIERSMSLLKNAGVFEKIGGLIIGKCADYKPSGTGLRPWEVMMEMLEEYDFPILAEFDSCHTRPMLTMPIGAEISLDADAQTVMLTGI